MKKTPPTKEQPAGAGAGAGAGEQSKSSGAGSGQKGGKGKWVVMAVAVAALLYWFQDGAAEIDPCDQTLAQAQNAAQNGAWQEVQALGKNAAALCEDKAREQQASDLQKRASTELVKLERAHRQEQQRNQQILKEQASCNQAVQNVQSALRERRLQTAERAWQGLNNRCKEQNTGLLSDLETQRNQVQQLLGQVTLNMQANNWEAVAAQLDQISQLNAEQKEVEQWRAQLRRAKAAQEASSAPAAPTLTAPASSSNESLFREFLRDAERHMNNHQYDRARALLYSANRLVPNHRDVQHLRQRIEAHESRYLSKEIVIE
ncbi:hypothetical protein [Comamonas jiangduensis]|uniref:hypothetical protein n=2 Tax=Comamonas jiangduensis TaxID=1194168 RepID=UPI003BF808AF